MKTLKNVFIVEDSPMERSMLKDHLGKIPNLKITEYPTGNACIKDLIVGRVDEPDLILMDYFLDSSFGPSKDGMESLTKLKEVSPTTNVIMFTSVDNPKIIALCKEKGALDYVVKGPEGFNNLDAVLKKHFTVSGS
jgi:response regulator of citrate/malate metabolism